jgi:hypothetical protein
MDYAEVIKLAYNVKKATEESLEAFGRLKEQSILLEKYTEQIRIEQRTDMEKWLEETLPLLFSLERVVVGQMDGYQHYKVVNDFIVHPGDATDEEPNRPLEVVQKAFVGTLQGLIEKPIAEGRKVLVRRVPDYHFYEEGYHRFYCRLLIEKATHGT